MDTEQKLNARKTFKDRPGHPCTFDLRPYIQVVVIIYNEYRRTENDF